MIKGSKGGEYREIEREDGLPWRREPALSESVRWGRGGGSKLFPHEALDNATLGENGRGVCV